MITPEWINALLVWGSVAFGGTTAILAFGLWLGYRKASEKTIEAKTPEKTIDKKITPNEIREENLKGLIRSLLN